MYTYISDEYFICLKSDVYFSCCETRWLYRRVIVIRLAAKQRPRRDANAFNDQLPLPSIPETVCRPVWLLWAR